MRFLHTSDLHLGKRLHEFSLSEDQRYILQQIARVAKEQAVDAVLISGDIYDRPVPSAEAVQLFDQFMTTLVKNGHMVFAINGNHDSAERLAFGAQLMRESGVYVSTVYDGTVMRIPLRDEYGELSVYLLPFLKPAVVRHALGRSEDASSDEEDIISYQDALSAALARAEVRAEERSVLLAHQFVTGAGRCDSEEIVVGGLDNVDASLFDAFDYAALGHIHSPQSVGRETVRYAGTPLKYSFSEAGQVKSVTIADLREKGTTEIRTVPLTPLRDLKKLRGSYQELMSRSFWQERNREDYVQITLTDEEDIPDVLARLRVIYPNLMRLEYDNRRTRQNQELKAVEELEKKSELELFCEFYEKQNNQPMSEEQKNYVEALIAKLGR